MKILHCCLAAFYIDNYGYQENILPKMHKIQGHDVEILASTETYLNNKTLGYVDAKKYKNENGILVNRVPYVKWVPNKLVRKLRIYNGINETLNHFNPDIIFLHDFQFLSIIQIVKYAKKRNVKIYADGHTDFINSAKNWVSKNILHKIIYKYCAKKIEPYVAKFYGTLPLRVKFIRDVYGINPKKIELLELGADDSSFDIEQKDNLRKKFRKREGIDEDDFVIFTGGKIDRRKNIHLLLEAVNNLKEHKKIKLLIFGLPDTDMEHEISNLIKQQNIIYLGWLSSDKIYEVQFASDLGFFPGTHSVLWEQTVGVGLPSIFKKWVDINHLDVGGNCQFLEDITVKSISDKILEIFQDKKLYSNMKTVASTNGVEMFSYSQIAKRAIEHF